MCVQANKVNEAERPVSHSLHEQASYRHGGVVTSPNLSYGTTCNGTHSSTYMHMYMDISLHMHVPGPRCGSLYTPT